ncbi:hypothetical protein [Chitinophaga vietnamensis]|uniref:hypothetical protein n=1 Tax=Chitinophaga vietnamensis TaxID=2593957 RepID=UPI0011779848|nr:hypothetical protein [Chitinophaga vietnamensis]
MKILFVVLALQLSCAPAKMPQDTQCINWEKAKSFKIYRWPYAKYLPDLTWNVIDSLQGAEISVSDFRRILSTSTCDDSKKYTWKVYFLGVVTTEDGERHKLIVSSRGDVIREPEKSLYTLPDDSVNEWGTLIKEAASKLK